jgi:hypothetical protein
MTVTIVILCLLAAVGAYHLFDEVVWQVFKSMHPEEVANLEEYMDYERYMEYRKHKK